MVGYLRLVLAYLVLLSHINLRIFDINPGVFAVVTFYILSGYVVTHLWDDVLPKGPGRWWRFCRDRALRIAPLYLYVTCLTLLFLAATGYAQPVYSPVKLLANVLIIPLNYYMWFDTTILTRPAWCLIPPAWSLGAEEQAYLLMSVLLLWPRIRYLLAPLSLLVFLCATFGIINTDFYGYRLLPGVFFIFIAGHCLCRIQNGKANLFDRNYPVVLWCIIASSALVLYTNGNYRICYVRETLSGLLIGIPLVYLLSGRALKIVGNSLCGSLSYGIFLSHFLVIWLLDYLGIEVTSHHFFTGEYHMLLSVVTLAIALAGIVWFEKPVDRYRKKI